MRYAVHNALIEHNPAYDLAGAIATAKSVHRPALPLERIAELMERIEAYKGKGLTQLAVRLCLLTFIRSSELRFARWSEFDFKMRYGRFLQNENLLKTSSSLIAAQR